jgi:c(7)-type cytochrome triheme protein
MVLNTTEISEQANRSGRFCGANGCHDGNTAFGHKNPDDCEKCHNGKRWYGKEKFTAISGLPRAKYGNGINWVKAVDRGMIKPAHYLSIRPPSQVAILKPLLLETEWGGIPAAIFSHKAHTQWLDCNNCHPDIFNIKKKTTKHFSMNRILKREFCGVCHLTVAFPMDDCKRCHSRQSSLKELP